MPTPDPALAPDPGRWHESRGYQLTTAAIVCPILPVIFTILRVYTRLILIKKHFWEDLSIVVALACTVLMSVFNGLAVVHGSGRHVETITAPDMVEFIKVGIAITQLYSLTHFFLKLSILLQYARVSVMPSDKRLCHVLIAGLCTGYLVFIVLRLVRRNPFDAQWTPGIPGASPLYILRHSSAALGQRVLIGVVLAFGGSVCIISVIRLHTLYPSTTSADPSWDKVPSAIYALAEINVGISCTSVVTLRPLFHSVRQTFRSENADASLQTEIMMPQQPVRRRFSDDLVLMADHTTHVGREGHGMELGGGVHNHSDSSVAGSKMG